MKKTPLPKLKHGEPSNYIIQGNTKSHEDDPNLSDEANLIIAEFESKTIKVPKRLTSPHPLVRKTRAILDRAKPDKYSERMLQLRELAGQTGSGYQPDIVMGFYHDHGDHDEKNPHVIFGDAKRYPESGIAGAYKSTIASTMIAYGHWGKLEIKAEPCWDKAFRAPVQPFFTLFFVPSSKDGKIRKQQILADFPIREFTLQQMQAPFVKEQPPCHQKETQDENTDINAWFKKITEQIEKLFSVEII